MIELLIDGIPISLTLHQALDLQAQIIQQMRVALIPAEEKMITTVEAIEIARQEGKHLPATTLRAALDAGAIQGIQKPAGRRLLPERQFRKWLATYKPRS